MEILPSSRECGCLNLILLQRGVLAVERFSPSVYVCQLVLMGESGAPCESFLSGFRSVADSV